MTLLILLFGIIALLYSSVGFGGGSSYLALLVLWELPYTIIPMLALACNIIVVSGNSLHYVRARHFDNRLLIPYLIGSIPLSYLGGTLLIDQKLFEWLIFLSLLIASLLMIRQHRAYDNPHAQYTPPALFPAISAGAALGFLSGLIGIGGGIFLAPLLYLQRAGSPRRIATTASLFILINSLAGLLGHLQKSGFLGTLLTYWPLLFAVFLGGQTGNLLSLKFFPLSAIVLITGILILFVSLRMGVNVTGLL
ncbi:MAG: sulfite exporter TauE/SafE family protein [Nitrosomonas sp. PRO4]|uniref:Probable membrane transporter protein n=1 Tax=Nitrosomonas nitrosa TaxID=52442 RepID=A0A8H8Z1A0_9PROT|nr:sulfite exporter TauE/SafE family protein [Nitrosomonas nitrosa]MCE7913947.1 sulfite exporter TauE/SafE family protein [Nitrosomonas sp. PRO4]CAE6508076.1 putative membrane transporter protein [Nitrosomonas nitrosa]